MVGREGHGFRSVTIDNGIYWQAQRWARFMAWFGEGLLRRLRDRPRPEPKFRAQSSSSSSSSSVVAGLIGRVMRLVALVVPQPAIDAVGGEQLRVRTAFDRPAA